MTTLPCCRGCQDRIALPRLTGEELIAVHRKVVEHLAHVETYGLRQQFDPVRGTRWDVNYLGHLAEDAWAKYRGLPPPPRHIDGVAFVKLPDMADRGEVRHTVWLNGCLPLHEPGLGPFRDDPTARFDLIVGPGNGELEWRGWLVAGDGQEDQFWREGPRYRKPAYFIPQGRLHGWPYHEPMRASLIVA